MNSSTGTCEVLVMARGVFLPTSEDLDRRPPLAREITMRRIAAGLTQVTLAERVGVSHMTIGFYEQGRMVPSDRTLAKIKAALGWR
jgi:DNA-binding XRE family transcriptional regulator